MRRPLNPALTWENEADACPWPTWVEQHFPDSMNTSTEPKEITAADVVAWLKAKAKASGVYGLTIVASSGEATGYEFYARNDKMPIAHAYGFGDTPDAAIASYKERAAPDKLAFEKRREAARLIAEADELTKAA